MNLSYLPYTLRGVGGLGALRTTSVALTPSPTRSTIVSKTSEGSAPTPTTTRTTSSIRITPITTREEVRQPQTQSMAVQNIIAQVSPTQDRGSGIPVKTQAQSQAQSQTLQNLINPTTPGRTPSGSAGAGNGSPQFIQTATGKKILVRPITTRDSVKMPDPEKPLPLVVENIISQARASEGAIPTATNYYPVVESGFGPSGGGGSGGGFIDSAATTVQQLIPGTDAVAARNLVKLGLTGLGLMAFVYFTRPKQNSKS